MTADRRRTIAAEVQAAFAVSQRRACRALGLARSGLRYVPIRRDAAPALARRIVELAGAHPRFGYRRIWALLRREGWSVNKKAVHRLWRREGLKLAGPRAEPRPRPPHGRDGNACHLRPSRGKDDVWTWDFIFDRTADGRPLKWLSIVDEFTRECLALEARRGMAAEQVRRVLEATAATRGGPPRRIRSDNGPEFVAAAVRGWLAAAGSGALHVAPGSPWQNGFAESFHSRLRDEFLECEEFEGQAQAQALGALWREEYNTARPHSALNYQTPAEFAATCERYVPIEPDPTDDRLAEQTDNALP